MPTSTPTNEELLRLMAQMGAQINDLSAAVQAKIKSASPSASRTQKKRPRCPSPPAQEQDESESESDAPPIAVIKKAKTVAASQRKMGKNACHMNGCGKKRCTALFTATWESGVVVHGFGTQEDTDHVFPDAMKTFEDDGEEATVVSVQMCLSCAIKLAKRWAKAMPQLPNCCGVNISTVDDVRDHIEASFTVRTVKGDEVKEEKFLNQITKHLTKYIGEEEEKDEEYYSSSEEEDYASSASSASSSRRSNGSVYESESED